MPVKIGPSPIRRTLDYLNAGKIVFREAVKIFSVNFNLTGHHHEGAREFIYWHLPQIQYKNPNVQCVTFKNVTPTPFIKIYLEDKKSVLIDIDSREKKEILDHLVNFTAICKTPNEIITEKKAAEKKRNFTYFGYGCERHCMCEILGQVPCPSIVLLPRRWRGMGLPKKKKPFYIPLAHLDPELKDDENEEND